MQFNNSATLESSVNVSEIDKKNIRKRKIKKIAYQVMLMAIRIMLLVIAVFPFYFALIFALKPQNRIAFFDVIPINSTLDGFKRALKMPNLLEGIVNTLWLTILTMLINALTSLLCGYALARLKFTGKKVISKIMMMSMMLPFTVVFLPTFIVLARFPLVGGNNILGQGGAGLVGGSTMLFGIVLPSSISIYNIFFLRQFFLTLPDELGDSARIDGAGELRTFFSIYLPLIKPALATLAVFSFQSGWNNYFWPNIVSQGRLNTITQVLREMTLGSAPDNIGAMALSLIVVTPMIILFLFSQRYFLRGTATAGMKE